MIFSDRAVHFATVRGTDTGGFLGQAPTGRPFSVFFVVLCTFRNQQIIHERRIYDFSALALQLAGESGAAFDSSRLYRRPLIERCSPMTSPLLQRFNKPCCHRLDLREPISR